MDLILKKMRSDFDLVAKARLESGEWTTEDIKEFSAVIKSCVESKDHTNLGLWARWLADLASGVVFFRMVVRPADSMIREAVSAAKAGGK